MLDYYDVSGCYILKPWSYFVWERIQGQCHQEEKCVCVRERGVEVEN